MVWHVIHAKSENHKLSNKVSTEAELFGTGEFFIHHLVNFVPA